MAERRDVGWELLAHSFGFTSEKEMLESMYEGSTIAEVAKALKTSQGTILRRLEMNGIPRKKRGGAQRTSTMKFLLFHVDQRLVLALTMKEACAMYGVSTATLYKYRQWKYGKIIDMNGTFKEAEEARCSSAS